MRPVTLPTVMSTLEEHKCYAECGQLRTSAIGYPEDNASLPRCAAQSRAVSWHAAGIGIAGAVSFAVAGLFVH
jgi:hypothetical protein